MKHFLRYQTAETASVAFDGLTTLKSNWDGYGAPAIRKDIIEAARNFVGLLPENWADGPRIVPMSTGNLQLEWHHGTKVLELEFEDAKTIHYLQWHPEAGVEVEATFPTSDIDTSNELIQWFMNGTTCV